MIQRQEKAQIPVDYQVIVTVRTGQSRLGLPELTTYSPESFAKTPEIPYGGQVVRPNQPMANFTPQIGLNFLAHLGPRNTAR